MNEKANKLIVINVKMVDILKEYPVVLPKGCVWFTLQVRDGTAAKLAVVSDKAATAENPYWNIKASATITERDLNISRLEGFTFYVACGTANKWIEVLCGVYDPKLDTETGD